MLLAVDVGNTQTVLGLFDGESSSSTGGSQPRPRDGDEIGALLVRLLELGDLGFEEVGGVCSPRPCRRSSADYDRFAERYAEAALLVIGPGTKTGIPILFDDPRRSAPTGS